MERGRAAGEWYVAHLMTTSAAAAYRYLVVLMRVTLKRDFAREFRLCYPGDGKSQG